MQRCDPSVALLVLFGLSAARGGGGGVPVTEKVLVVDPRPDQLATPSHQHGEPPAAGPHYHYRYAVASRRTGDVKGAWEKRAGGDVWGAYFLRDPDGHWRTVHYEADKGGFHAVVQRRPLPSRGKLTEPGSAPGSEHAAQSLGDMALLEWEDALAAAEESAREDSHPALRAAAASDRMEEAASSNSISTTSRSLPQSEADRRHYVQDVHHREPAQYGMPPGPAGPRFGPRPRPKPRPEPRPELRPHSRPAHASEHRETSSWAPGWTSAHEEKRQQPTPTSPSASYNVPEAATATYRGPDSGRHHNSHHDDEQVQQHEVQQQRWRGRDEYETENLDEDKGYDGYDGYNQDEVPNGYREEQQSEEVRDEERGDDVREELPAEQAPQSSQVRHAHEVLQVHAPEVYSSPQHAPHAPHGPQLRTPHAVHSMQQLHDGHSMEQLLGPAWAEVESQSALFEGSDWPGLRGPGVARGPRGSRMPHGLRGHRFEAIPQDTRDAPTWVRKGRGRGEVRGPGRWQGGQSNQLPAAPAKREPFGWQRDRHRGAPRQPPAWSSARSPARQESPAEDGSVESSSAEDVSAESSEELAEGATYGSKLPAAPTGTPPPPPPSRPSPPSSRGASRNQHNRGPVLFAHPNPNLEPQASTLTGDQRARPAADPWPHSKNDHHGHQRQRHPKFTPGATSWPGSAGWKPISSPRWPPTPSSRELRSPGTMTGASIS